MPSRNMSAGSDESVDSIASNWGEGDPGMGMTGVHLRVLGGRSVWPLAFHELMAADDPRAHVGRRLAGADFTPEPLGPQTAGAWFLDRVLRGEAVDWTAQEVPPGEVDRVLAALGLYHVRVRCVIPEELGGQYERAVSVALLLTMVVAVRTDAHCRSVKMLWWGIDETLAELFARHPSSGDFEGNPVDAFQCVIAGGEYGPDQTPRSLGLYGGRYTIEFHPGEST